jgi:hypothetical protein
MRPAVGAGLLVRRWIAALLPVPVLHDCCNDAHPMGRLRWLRRAQAISGAAAVSQPVRSDRKVVELAR